MPNATAVIVGMVLFCTCPLLASSRAFAQGTPAEAQATVVVRGFAPDAVIAVDGTPVASGQWTGSVAPGQHLVQVYKPGGPAYEFPFTAVAGQSVELPPRDTAPAPSPGCGGTGLALVCADPAGRRAAGPRPFPTTACRRC